jgi:hypothetical protein
MTSGKQAITAGRPSAATPAAVLDQAFHPAQRGGALKDADLAQHGLGVPGSACHPDGQHAA